MAGRETRRPNATNGGAIRHAPQCEVKEDPQ